MGHCYIAHVASLHRTIARLGVRRQRHILGQERSRLSTNRLLGDARGTFVASFFFTFFAAMFTDFIVATWREAPMVLGPLELIGVGGAGALVMVGAREIRQRSLVAGQPEPRQLAAAVEHELDVGQERRAEVERLEVSAQQAFWVEGSQRRSLLLDCGPDGWVLLSPPAQDTDPLPPLRQRWRIERLRWTHAILSITSHGPPMAATILDVPNETFEGLDACEVLDRVELPVGLAAALPSAAMGYRA